MKPLLAFVLTTVLSLPAVAATPSFEAAASNVKGLVKTLKKNTAKDKKVVFGAATNMWQDTECYDIEFKKKQGALSNLHMLTSRTWIEECRRYGGRYGGCFPERRAWNHVQSVTIEVVGRVAPGPHEIFEVCMTGPWIKFKRTKQSPFQYDAKQTEENDIVRIKLTVKKPKAKK